MVEDLLIGLPTRNVVCIFPVPGNTAVPTTGSVASGRAPTRAPSGRRSQGWGGSQGLVEQTAQQLDLAPLGEQIKWIKVEDCGVWQNPART